MVTLTGNLGNRHRQFNAKVQDAVRDKINFDEIKTSPETSDVDMLFKIELASKYQNIDFIVEILKSGDSLFISKALKCFWIYNDKFSHYMNTDFLHHNIFPFMSIKMKHKMLSAVAVNIRDHARIVAFYEYCQSAKMPTYALKFLLHTSEADKLEFLRTKTDFMFDNDCYLKHFINNSFILIDAYCKNIRDYRRIDTLIQVSYLYTVDAVKYLELLEKYIKFDNHLNSNNNRFGITISKSIMKKNKTRVNNNPLFYLNILNEKMISRYITSEDAKKFTTALFTGCEKSLWLRGYKKYKYMFNSIPISERMDQVKAVYNLIHPDIDFEMTKQFYDLKCYDMMTESEKEKWALRSLEQNSELLGCGKDYLWYKFVNFQHAFKEIKKRIYYTTVKDVRSSMIETLVETAKTRDDVATLLTYYYDRHVNEDAYYTDMFLEKICTHNNVFDFDEDCWTSFFKLWNSMKGYSIETYIAISVIYYILHNKDLIKVLQEFIDSNMNVYIMKQEIKNLNKEKQDMVYTHLLMYFMNNLQNLVNIAYSDETKAEIRKIIRSILNLNQIFNKTTKELPDLVKKYGLVDDELKSHFIIVKEKINEKKIIETLKKDPSSLVALLPRLRETFKEEWYIRYINASRTIRIYFHNDIVQELITFLNQCMITEPESTLDYGLAQHAVFMLFQLGKVSFLENFMTKYAPSQPKIQYDTIDRNVLKIQEAICRFVCYSRPPVSLEIMSLYMKGDYIRYCLPAINKLYANLPQKTCLQFVESMINAPVSLQKHGLRLAFKCFSTDNLRKVALHTWSHTKNVSLREVLYISLFNKVIDVNDSDRNILFKILITFTEDLQETDTDNLFDRNRKLDKLPDDFKGAHVTASWKSVCKFSLKEISLERQIQVLRLLKDNITLLEEGDLRSIIDDHLHQILTEKQISLKQTDSLERLIQTKWQIVAKYLVTYDNDKEMLKRKMLMRFILQKIFEMWDEVQDGAYSYKRLFYSIVSFLESECRARSIYSKSASIFEELLRIVKENIPKYEIYLLEWRLKLDIAAKSCLSCVKNDEENIEIIANNVSLEIGKTVKEYVNNNMFHMCFVKEISELYYNTLAQISYFLSFDYEEFSISVADHLIKHNIREIYLIVINTLPVDGKVCDTEIYRECINKIQQYNDDSVQSFINHKFYGQGNFSKKI